MKSYQKVISANRYIMANSELFALRYITADRTQTSLKLHFKKTQSTTASL